MVRTVAKLVDEGLFEVNAVIDLYSGCGSSICDPRLLLKLALFEHARGIAKPIQWHRDLSNDREVQWLVWGLQAGKSTLYSFRDRIEPLLKQWNDQVVQTAMSEGLVSGKRASLDGTAVAANASKRALMNAMQLRQRLDRLEQELAQQSSLEWSVTTLDEQAKPGWLAPTHSGKLLQYDRYCKAQLQLEELLEANRLRRKDKQKPIKKVVVNVTDPESIFGMDKDKTYRPLYNVQLLCDLSTEFVLGYDVAAIHSDSGTLEPMIAQALQASIQLEVVLADAGYPTGEELAYCDQVGVTLYAPWQENSFSNSKRQSNSQSQIDKDSFRWDAANQQYTCPTGNALPFSLKKTRQRADGENIQFDLYRASGEDCSVCPLRTVCTKSPDTGRTVRRAAHQNEIDDLKARMATVEAKAVYGLRNQTVERIIGDFKEHRGLRRFRGRGLSRASVQLGLTVLSHNLRQLHNLRQSRIAKSSQHFIQQIAA